MIASVMTMMSEMPDDMMLDIEVQMQYVPTDMYGLMTEKQFKDMQSAQRYGPLPEAIESVLQKALYIYEKPEVIN
jgi:hypothetical protein